MVLSGRERYILLAALVGVGALALDRLAVAPLGAMRDKTADQRQSLRSEWDRAQGVLALRAQMAPKWQEMTRSGLKSDPDEADQQVLHALNDWAKEAGVSLTLLKPERLSETRRLPEIAFQVAGTGDMRSVARLLWRVQTATIPIKVTELQISARKEGTDDLSFQVRTSTVYAPPRSARATPAGARSNLSGGR